MAAVCIPLICVGSCGCDNRCQPLLGKSGGSNPVTVLATLFLLSYVKLLCTIIAALSYTTVEYPNSQIAVWLYDANVRYLSSEHIPLIAAALICLIFHFLPYTMLLTFGQWLQAKSELLLSMCCPELIRKLATPTAGHGHTHTQA